MECGSRRASTKACPRKGHLSESASNVLCEAYSRVQSGLFQPLLARLENLYPTSKTKFSCTRYQILRAGKASILPVLASRGRCAVSGDVSSENPIYWKLSFREDTLSAAR